MKKLIFAVLLLAFGATLNAQIVTREDDHFWRRKVVNRIDLTEKVNMPLIKRESQWYADNKDYKYSDGLVKTLFDGLEEGVYTAYSPDSIDKPLSYEDVVQRIQDIESGLSGTSEYDDFGGGFDESGFGEEGLGDEGFDEGFSDDFGMDEFGGDEFGGGDWDMGGDDLGGDPAFAGAGGGGSDLDLGAFENVIQFVEDRIFDKTRAAMIYDIQFIEIIWTDPGEALPDKPLCVFRYHEVKETLEAAQWKNRFNDAEYRNLRQVFDLRLFHSYIINVSGVGMRTLQESESRRQQMVEFEHHLWSY